MKVMVKCKRWLDSYRDTYMFFCLLIDGLFQIMCIASFNINLNGVEAESIISEQFSVLRDLKVSLLTRHAKMWDFLSVSKCSLTLVDNGEFVSPMQQGLQPGQTNLSTIKGFKNFGIGIFMLNILETVNGVKTILILKLLQ